MKKILVFMLAALLCFSLLVSCNLPGGEQESGESVSVEKEPEESSSGAEDGETEKEPAIRMMKYNVFYCDISTKSIYAGELADAIIEGIEALEPTGETVEKISDEVVDQYSQDLPVPYDTMWLEIGDKIYRIDPEGKIYLVESHLGAGVALETVSEELKVDINKAWFYYPGDYYLGTYYNETNEIELKNMYSTQNEIEVNVKDIAILSTCHHDEVNKITVELISTVDGTFDIDWRSESSSDNIGSMGDTCVELKAGVPQTVELAFCGWDDFYWLYIYVSNVAIELKIIP